jgi:hypothetical protein
VRNLCAIGFLLIAACAPRPPVRGAGTANPSDLERFAENPYSPKVYARVQGASSEPHSAYTLSFVEFDSQGRPARPGQIETAEASIREMSDKGVVVLFVHGWGHSADARDEHVYGFREALSGLKRDLPDRSIVGIYVSWPARWLKGRLHYLTFLDRSRAAENISRTQTVRQILRGIQSAIKERGATADIVSVAVGHSLGGKFLFTPMEERLEGDTDEPRPENPRELPLVGDLVLLVNPAQDTHDFNAFTRYARGHCAAPPAVVILSSEADGVVGRAFKFGRTVRGVFTPWNWGHFRSERIGLGWDPRQVTHILCSTKADPGPSPLCDLTSRGKPDNVVEYGSTELRRYGARRGPFPVVRVDGRIIASHSDIFNEDFLGFLRAFVADNARQGAEN